jgi:hypothetical protein
MLVKKFSIVGERYLHEYYEEPLEDWETPNFEFPAGICSTKIEIVAAISVKAIRVKEGETYFSFRSDDRFESLFSNEIDSAGKVRVHNAMHAAELLEFVSKAQNFAFSREAVGDMKRFCALTSEAELYPVRSGTAGDCFIGGITITKKGWIVGSVERISAPTLLAIHEWAHNNIDYYGVFDDFPHGNLDVSWYADETPAASADEFIRQKRIERRLLKSKKRAHIVA